MICTLSPKQHCFHRVHGCDASRDRLELKALLLYLLSQLVVVEGLLAETIDLVEYLLTARNDLFLSLFHRYNVCDGFFKLQFILPSTILLLDKVGILFILTIYHGYSLH